ncbi:FAD synthetase family protein [Aneurinibacillus sp. BA2021]|nr:FAD synthetase family protein [Aneurinibacillus sp. BA2021]
METVWITHESRKTIALQDPCVAALGFFDGVHLGHQAVIAEAKNIATKQKIKLSVLTFFPHPKEVLAHQKDAVRYLMPFAMKQKRLAELGVDVLYVIRFTPAFAALSPQQFVTEYLLALDVKHVVAGFDFTYGCRGEGSMRTIGEHGQGRFGVTTVGKVDQGAEKISSTRIRDILAGGNVGSLPRYLGSFYETRGRISPACTMDPNIGPGTAIVSIDDCFTLPKPGVYETEAMIASRYHTCISRIHCSDRPIVEIESDCIQTVKQHAEICLRWIRHVGEETALPSQMDLMQ